jgi:hypothetical protein
MILYKKHNQFFYENLLCSFMPFVVQNANKTTSLFINLMSMKSLIFALNKYCDCLPKRFVGRRRNKGHFFGGFWV